MSVVVSSEAERAACDAGEDRRVGYAGDELDKRQLASAVAGRLSFAPGSVSYVLQQTSHGATVPFLARYRRDQTGQLSEDDIRRVLSTAEELAEVHRRREFMLKSLAQRGLLTPELRASLARLVHLTQLEDFWEAYKERKSSLATRGREAGLGPVALHFITNPAPLSVSLQRQLSLVADGERLFMAIVLEEVQRCEAVRLELLRAAELGSRLRSALVSHARKKEAKSLEEADFAQLKKKFGFYDGKVWSVRKVNAHIVLALARGERKGVLKVEQEAAPGSHQLFMRLVARHFPGLAQRLKGVAATPSETSSHVTSDEGSAALHGAARKQNATMSAPPQGLSRYEQRMLRASLDYCYEHLMKAVHLSVRRDLRKSAELQAIEVFARNLRHMLLQRPMAQTRLLALDPGLRNGVKCVALDEHGGLLSSFTCTLLDETKMRQMLRGALLEQRLNKIVIGNGTASQQTSLLVADLIRAPDLQHVEFAVVSEAGASVYSVSDIAKEEFPKLSIMYRGAVSIGRRVLDPLSELVKIPVRSMGIGMYQHDVNEKALVRALNDVVESCVTSVGINASSANRYIMEKVPGMQGELVAQVVLARHTRRLESREDLRRVPGMTEATYMQIAGFFRFPNSREELDNTRIHPESYELVRRLLQLHAEGKLGQRTEPDGASTNVSVPVPSDAEHDATAGSVVCAELDTPTATSATASTSTNGATKADKAEADAFAARRSRLAADLARLPEAQLARLAHDVLHCGVETLRLIIKELQHPGLDPRARLPHAGLLRREVRAEKDLVVGEALCGVVQSVTPFGAFVDCGLHHAVLVRAENELALQVGMFLRGLVFTGLDAAGRPRVSYKSQPTVPSLSSHEAGSHATLASPTRGQANTAEPQHTGSLLPQDTRKDVAEADAMAASSPLGHKRERAEADGGPQAEAATEVHKRPRCETQGGAAALSREAPKRTDVAGDAVVVATAAAAAASAPVTKRGRGRPRKSASAPPPTAKKTAGTATKRSTRGKAKQPRARKTRVAAANGLSSGIGGGGGGGDTFVI